MLKLHTFGGVYITRDGAVLGGAAAQRRLLALLAVLATAGEGGVSRDRLLGLLWPDADGERARHALTQALYNARRALRCDDVFIATASDIRLNPERLASDVGEFTDAVARGDFAAAVRAYQGPFLDGFFVAGAAEFEPWASLQRSRLASDAAAALDEIAAEAESRGGYADAAELRKRRVALDPLDSAAVVKLMTVLAASGDHVAALQHARVHETLLRQELDAAPHPAVAALAARLKEAPVNPAPAATLGSANVRPGPSGTAPAEPTDAPRATVAAPDAGSGRAREGRPARPSSRSRWAGGVAAVVGALAVVVIVTTVRDHSGATTAAAAPVGRQAVVVAPFRVAGADPALAYLREGIVELLSMRLADDSTARAVDPGAVLESWRAAGLSDAADVARTDAARLAERLGAHTLVLGSVVGSPSMLLVSASLVGVPAGDVRVSESVEGPADSLSALVDRLAVRLLAADAGEGDRLDSAQPPPLASLRAYLSGQASYRRANFADAVRHYERALAGDSTFALAALRLALAADRLNAGEQHDRALALAWTHRGALSASDRAHLTAFAGPRYPAPSSGAEQLAAWERAAVLAPDRAEVWQELGERFYYDGAVIGASDWGQRAAAAFRRTLALDPRATSARALLILAAARAQDTATLARLATAPALRDSAGELRPFLTWRVAIARDDEAALRSVREMFPRLDAANLRSIAMSSLFDGVGVPDGERAMRIRRSLATHTAEDLDALLAQHSFALNQGRPVLTLDLTEQVQELQPGTRAHLRLRVLDALYAQGDRPAAERAARELAPFADAPLAAAPEALALQLADLCVLEQWRLARGDTHATTRVIARLRAAGPLLVTVPVAAPPLACAELLSAMRAVATREPAALARVERLDSLMLTGPAVSDAGTYAHLVVADLYARLGEPRRALAAIRRRGYMSGWPRYLGTARREEGRLALAAGDTAGAVEAYRRYLALRRDPEGAVTAGDASIRRLVDDITERRWRADARRPGPWRP